MTSLVLVRHGVTAWNLESRYTSRTDLPLHPSAGDALAAVATALAGEPVARVLVSPMRRALETAVLLARAGVGAGLAPEVVDDLREADFGAFEGRTRAELAAGELADRFEAWFRPAAGLPGAPDGESWESVTERAVRVLDRVATLPGVTLAVSHGYLIKVLVVTADPAVPRAWVRDSHVPNGAIVALDRVDGGWRVREAPVVHSPA